jgi:2-methylcitrate dehydratase PrpD
LLRRFGNASPIYDIWLQGNCMASGPTIPPLRATIAEFVHASAWRDLPSVVIDIARQHLLDTIGCCLAATKVDTSRLLRTYLLAEGGAEQATAMAMPRRLPMPQAAFRNGPLARRLEFDDMAMPDLHPAGVVVPTALAYRNITAVQEQT